MKKLLPVLAVTLLPTIGLTTEIIKKDGDVKFENSESLKEYTYHNKGDVVFWYDDGRPFWSDNAAYSDVQKNELPNLSMPDLDIGEEEVVLKKRIRFPMEKATLDDQDKEALNDVIERISKIKDEITTITIQGHASKPGTPDFNMELSEKRAETVKEYLVARGISSLMIDTEAHGEKKALKDREKSRRVVIEVAKY